jgi:hypothetical protein
VRPAVGCAFSLSIRPCLDLSLALFLSSFTFRLLTDVALLTLLYILRPYWSKNNV